GLTRRLLLISLRHGRGLPVLLRPRRHTAQRGDGRLFVRLHLVRRDLRVDVVEKLLQQRLQFLDLPTERRQQADRLSIGHCPTDVLAELVTQNLHLPTVPRRPPFFRAVGIGRVLARGFFHVGVHPNGFPIIPRIVDDR